MRFSRILVVLGYTLLAGAQLCSAAGQAQTAPTSARTALEQMSPAERKNSNISVEFESSDNDAVALGREVERLWNGGEFDGALAQLGNLEVRVAHVAIGNSWREPVPTREAGLWGRDVRIGNRDSLLGLSLETDVFSRNLFVVLRHNAAPPHYSICMSTDGGVTWNERYTWSGSPPTSLDAAILANHLYVVHNSPGENAQEHRLRRFWCSDGSRDSFQGGGSFVVPCTLSVGDTMREVSLVANRNNNRLYIVTLVSDGSVLVSADDSNAVSWTKQPTGIASGARYGLDATADKWSDRTIFFSYCDTSDTVRVYDGGGQRLAEPAGMGTLTSISANLDTVVCVYEDATTSPRRVSCASSLDGGDAWTMKSLSDTGVAADAPSVAISGGAFAAVYRRAETSSELLFCQRTYSGIGTAPVTLAENGLFHSRPGIVDLGTGAFGVAYLSDTSPVVRGAFFDRSDWVYGVAEQQRPQASDCTPLATVIRGVLSLPRDMTELRSGNSDRVPRPILLDIGGRKVLDLRPGANDVRALAPGVYFIREGLGKTRKVVVTR